MSRSFIDGVEKRSTSATAQETLPFRSRRACASHRCLIRQYLVLDIALHKTIHVSISFRNASSEDKQRDAISSGSRRMLPIPMYEPLYGVELAIYLGPNGPKLCRSIR